MENQNRIWLGTRSSGIFLFENETFIEFSKPQYNYPTYSIVSLAVDQNENIWYCFLTDTSGRNSVSFWDGAVFNSFYPGFPDNILNHIYIDGLNSKWISSSSGLLRFDTQNSLTTFTTENSLISSNIITAAVKDNSGNIWITSSTGGLNKYKPPD
jgi:ligand-binding sensor domain-containing protein